MSNLRVLRAISVIERNTLIRAKFDAMMQQLMANGGGVVDLCEFVESMGYIWIEERGVWERAKNENNPA